MMTLFNFTHVFVIILTFLCNYSLAVLPCNANGTAYSSTLCSCYSGYYGNDCFLTASSLGCISFPVHPLQTDNPFYLGEFFVQGNMLALTAISPLVSQRLNSSIFIQGAENSLSCSYPGLNWIKSVVNCQDRFSTMMPLTQMLSCGTWTIDNTHQELSIYRSVLNVASIEVTSFLRNTKIVRNLHYSFPLQVTFQKSVLLSSGHRSYSPIVLAAIVSDQHVDVASGTGSIQLTTSVQYPFKYFNPVLVKSPRGFTITSIKELTATMANTIPECNEQDPTCQQVWQVNFNLGTNCQLDGEWDWQFNETCQSSRTHQDCPVASPEETDTVTTVIVSENFCSIAQVDISLSSVMNTYSNAQHTQSKLSFSQGSTAYFSISMDSPYATIISSSIVELVTSSTSSTIFLMQNGTAQIPGILSNIKIADSIIPKVIDFSFTVNQYSAPVSTEANLEYTVRAKILVTFNSMNQQGAKREIYADLQMSNNGLAQTLTRSSFTALKRTSSASINSISMINVIAVMLVVLLVQVV